MSTSLGRALVVLTMASASAAAAQNVPAGNQQADPEADVAAAAVRLATPGTPAPLTYANRQIVVIRSSLPGRPPHDRVAAALATLDRLTSDGITGPVRARQVGDVVSLEVADRRVVAILPTDVDTLAGETPASAGAAAARRLEVVLNELAELRRPWQLLGAVLQVLAVTALYAGLIWLLLKGRIAALRRVHIAADRLKSTRAGAADLVQSSRIIELVQRGVALLLWLAALFIGYGWLTFSLRRFPYTRPWGESLREFLTSQLSNAGLAILHALPNLFTVALIYVITRFVSRLVQLLFHSIETRRTAIPWLYPETAEPTRKLLTVGLWLFALVMAYPYLPGSGSEAFKGMSVFVGLVVSLGSSGIVNQVMSGFTLIYSRALRVGDFVQVGDTEGTVSQVGTLSTKIKTAKGEDVTIPNALMVSQTVTNYSRFSDTGVYVPTEVTIGYDTPWRQVEALLLLAATRSQGVRRDPAPLVLKTALEDAYVRYTLLFCPENPVQRRGVLAAVHANILDAFNEYGVQITSPNYEADPDQLKIVPRDQWFAAPAAASPTVLDSTGQGSRSEPEAPHGRGQIRDAVRR